MQSENAARAGRQSFTAKTDGFYYCRFLDFFGNKIESYFKLSSFNTERGVLVTSVHPAKFFDLMSFKGVVRS